MCETSEPGETSEHCETSEASECGEPSEISGTLSLGWAKKANICWLVIVDTVAHSDLKSPPVGAIKMMHDTPQALLKAK